MIKLSSLPQAPDESQESYVVGVEADIPDFNPPKGLTRIAFTAKMDGKAFDETLLDALIGSTMAGLDTIIEVPLDDEIDPKFLVTLAANLNASISLLPSEENNLDESEIEANRQKWYARNEAYASVMLTTENFNRYLHPVSSFLEYMFAEVLHPVEAMVPNDPYVLIRFADKLPQDVIDELKLRLRKIVYDTAGGEEEFRVIARALYHRIYRMADDNARDIVEKARAAKEARQASESNANPGNQHTTDKAKSVNEKA